MNIEVHGGAGGVTARYTDMRAHADVLDRAGDEVRNRADDVAKVALDGSVVASALLCPVEAAAVGVQVADAAAHLLVVTASFEGSALVLRATVESYVFLDETRQRVMEGLQQAASYAIGFGLGVALPGLALGGLVIAAGNPALVALAAAALQAHGGELLDGALTTLFENPWLMEELTQSAPWLIQGLTSGLGSLLPGGGLLAPFLLSGGQWPTTDYESAVGGLVSAGGLFGLFDDDGDWVPVPADTIGAQAPGSIADIFGQQSELGEKANHGQIQIVRVPGPPESFIVQIPGTQEWSPERGGNPVDLTTNVHLMAGHETALMREVAEAMRAAGIEPGDEVMLTGHSQGGILCAALASDPEFMDDFTVTSVVTGGSPIARFDIPPGVDVLALEHDQDPVPMLEGRENPDRTNWVTVERDITGVTVPDGKGGTTEVADPGAAHGTGVYETTGALVDGSDDPSVQAWLEDNAHFLDPEGAEVTRWEFVPTGQGAAAPGGGPAHGVVGR